MFYFEKLIKNLSLKKKLILLGMITSTIATAVTCTGFVFFNIFEERRDLIEEMTLVGEILSEDISGSVVYKEKKIVDESLAALKVRDTIIQACVFDAEHNEITHFINSEFYFAKCSDLPKLNKRYEFVNLGVFNRNLIVATPIRYENTRHGTFYTVTSLQKINEKVRRSLYNSLILFMFILGTSYIISRVLQKNVSDPILRLSDISYAVKSGDYDIRSKYQGSDEIGELSEVFNNMLNVIQDSKENLELKVKERTFDLEKALKVKAEFLSNMSHEIRTPIHGIMNYADFLVHDWKKMNDSKRFEFLTKLHNNSDRLLSLINNLLDLSKLDAQKLDFKFDKFDLVEIIDNVIQEVEPLNISKKIEIKFNYDKNISYLASVDNERIIQVIRNLFSNALKFTEKGQITVSLFFIKYKFNKSEVPAFKFIISDDGIGIPTKELNNIFDKFIQSSTTRTGAGGTGLGLAICKEIIKAHRGLIWAENNKESQGASFIFIIPENQPNKRMK